MQTINEIVNFLREDAEIDCMYELEKIGFSIIDDGEEWFKGLDYETSRAIIERDGVYFGIDRRRTDMYIGYVNSSVGPSDVYEVVPFEKTITCYRKKSEMM